jgi:hypothetical protein
MGKSREPPQPCTVEELLRRVGSVSPTAQTFELWVPECLTLDGKAIDGRAALAIILSRVREVSEEFVLVGFGGLSGGRLHKFERWPDAEPAAAPDRPRD